MLPRAWTSLGPLGRAGGVLLSIGLIVALAALLLKWAPEWLVSGGLKGKDRAEDVGRLRTAILATLAGVLASIGAYYTHRTLKLNRENLEHNRETAARSHALDQVRQITERFRRAIDQLGDRDRLDVRLGGIYALERIARDSVDHHPQVVEVLTAFVREHAPWRLIRSEAVPTAPVCAETGDESMESVHTPKSTADVSHAESNTAATARRGNQQSSDAQAERIEPPTDSQAAISVLGRRDVSQDRAGAQLNLRRTDLRGLVLEAGPGHWHEAHLEGAYLDGANLQDARLSKASLQDARLSGANLRNAELSGANLEHAKLGAAHLEHAELFGANLEHAELSGAHLEHAKLDAANLRRARLSEAYLQDAHLPQAKLDNARLPGATSSGQI